MTIYGVYRVKGGDKRAVTDDPKKLPPLPSGQEWVFEKKTQDIQPGDHTIGGSADVKAQVDDPTKGYYEWPQPKP